MNPPFETTWQQDWPWPIWTMIAAGMTFLLWIAVAYRLDPNGRGKVSRVLATGLRITVAMLLLWTLFGWQRQEHRTEPADLVVAIDDSASMAFRDDQWDAAQAAQIRRWLPGHSTSKSSRFEVARTLLAHPRYGWLHWLPSRYNVRFVRLADTVRTVEGGPSSDLSGTSPDRPSSRLGTGLRELIESQRGRPTAAFVLLTDGTTTEGPNVSEAADLARERGIPIYIIGVGSNKPLQDLRLADLLADDVAFVDDTVSISCQLHASGLTGKSTMVHVRRDDTGELLAEQSVTVPQGDAAQVVRLSFRAKDVGEYRLRVEVDSMPGEANTENNKLSHQLTVHDATIHVLLAYSYPSYEYRYLRNLLSRLSKSGPDSTTNAFSLTTILQEADRQQVEEDEQSKTVFPIHLDELSKYDVVILGDIDPTFLGGTASAHLVEFVREQGGGIVFIAGPQFLPQAYRRNRLAELFPFDVASTTAPSAESLAVATPVRLTPVGQTMPACQLLPIPQENTRLWESLPGLYWQWKVPEPSPAARVLVEQAPRTNATEKRLPTVLLQYFGAGRIVFHATDESYRWARYEETDEYYSRYWVQTIRYLGRTKLLRGRSPAEISVDRQQFVQGENVSVRVRFLREGLAASPEGVSVMIEPQQGAKQELALSSSKNNPEVFTGVASGLVPGSYRVWLSSPSLEKPPDSRAFSVVAAGQELAIKPMDASDLQLAAKVSEGRFYTLANAERLPHDLPRGQQVRIESLPPQPIWNSPWIAGAFILLLTAEWILRKRAGML